MKSHCSIKVSTLWSQGNVFDLFHAISLLFVYYNRLRIFDQTKLLSITVYVSQDKPTLRGLTVKIQVHLFFTVPAHSISRTIKLNPLLVVAIGEAQLTPQSSANRHAHTVVPQYGLVDICPLTSLAEYNQVLLYDDFG